MPCAMPFSVVPSAWSSSLSCGSSFGERALLLEQAHLQQVERIDVRVSERERALKEAMLGDSMLALADGVQCLHVRSNSRQDPVDTSAERRRARVEVERAISRSALAHTISILSSRSSKNGQVSAICCRSSSPPGSRMTLVERRARAEPGRQPSGASASSRSSTGWRGCPGSCRRRARGTPGASRSARGASSRTGVAFRNSWNSARIVVHDAAEARAARLRSCASIASRKRASRRLATLRAPVGERRHQRAGHHHLEAALGDRQAGRTSGR